MDLHSGNSSFDGLIVIAPMEEFSISTDVASGGRFKPVLIMSAKDGFPPKHNALLL
jgi:hypothetical protein